MDTFFEQLIAVKRDGKSLAIIILIWIAAVALSVLSFFLAIPICILVTAGSLYGAYRLTGNFSAEYEYIITNGVLDIDRIIAKRTRKRIISFELSSVESVEKYNPAAAAHGNFTNKIIACNPDENAYRMIITAPGKGKTMLVFAPNEKLISASLKFLPKHIANSAFKA